MKEDSKNNKLAGLIGTLLFHGLLLLLFWLIVFKTPIPPFPEEGGGGYEVNFGTSETGSGDVQPEEVAGNNADVDETDVPTEPTHTTRISSSKAENIMTNDDPKEETAEVVKGKSETKVESKESPKAEEATKVEERKANSKFSYKKKKGSASTASEGTTVGTGDQGSLDGSRNTLYHGNGGNGSGNGDGGGNGSGTSNGSGTGSNSKTGPIKYDLVGRKAGSLPIPKASFTEEGRVVVEIKVDQNGVVVSAKPGVKGSTTTNPQLMEIARKAAMSASFNTNNDAPDVQKGTITYNFYLR